MRIQRLKSLHGHLQLLTNIMSSNQIGIFFLLPRELYEDVMKKDTIPEIQRANLSKVVLSLKCMNINNVLHFHYLDPPSERLLLRALWHLYVIGAVNR